MIRNNGRLLLSRAGYRPAATHTSVRRILSAALNTHYREPNVTIRDATESDLAAIVDIYNQAIPGRRATADTEPVTVADRSAWFAEHDARSRPLWIVEEGGVIAGWLSLQSFYGRPAYHATAEVSIYISSSFQRRGIARTLLREVIARSETFGVSTLLGFIFGHNEASLRLFGSEGFERWGFLPRVAELDGVERDLAIVGRRVGNS
jgi:L-amino acid N-acyltransferase YncA